MTLAKTLSEHGSFQYVVVSVRNTATTEELPSRLSVIRFPGTHKNRRCLGHPTVLSWGKKMFQDLYSLWNTKGQVTFMIFWHLRNSETNICVSRNVWNILNRQSKQWKTMLYSAKPHGRTSNDPVAKQKKYILGTSRCYWFCSSQFQMGSIIRYG